LNALTKARAKVGDYAFTTLHPQVGIVEYKDYTQIAIADLPGVLPDLTRGFGTRYFRHLERCKMIIFVVDLASGDEPYKQYIDMCQALNFYDKTLLETRPLLIAANKVDKPNANENLAKLRQQLQLPIVPVSAEKRINLTKLLNLVRSTHERLKSSSEQESL
jgi:GTPase